MLSNINSIIESNDEIIDFKEIHNIELGDKMLKINFMNKKKDILKLIDFCNSYIKALCNHEFINDNIDIDLDNSQTITYCRICELSEEYCKSL